MSDSACFKDYRAYTNFLPDRYGKATLFENDAILVGLNCLVPGQCMQKHAHVEQNRFYLVLEGSGKVWVDEEEQLVSGGMLVWVPAGRAHRIENQGEQPLVMLVGIAPAHAD
ncbi:MAG: cupin domain-containing protein [Chloroflexi bacterium]|nr:cupin domain-containing protein [Chloroflexota bacterium]